MRFSTIEKHVMHPVVGSELQLVTALLVQLSLSLPQAAAAVCDLLQLCLEFMANHISPASDQFKDFVQNGEASRFKDMFVHWEDIWPEGAPLSPLAASAFVRQAGPCLPDKSTLRAPASPGASSP